MIPVNEPLLAEEDFEALTDCFRSGWISSAGAYVDEFESAWAAYCGVEHGIAVSNGTTALQVAVEALGIAAGDEVIMPSFTIIACASAIVRVGAVPVLVDCEAQTFNMRVDQIEACITPRTRAIMVVHMYGHPVDMDGVLALAARYDLRVIEDAAEVHGARYLSGRDSLAPVWKTCGSMGDIATFSFFANKLITTGEGGMLVTRDAALAERCRSLRNLCFVSERRFLHKELGHNFRLTNMQAAVGFKQVGRIEEIVARKRWVADAYTQRLSDLPLLQLPHEHAWARAVYWVYAIVLRDECSFDAQGFAQRLKEKGVETRPFFLGMHEQPVFLDRGLFAEQRYPVAERIARRGLYLPSGLALTLEQIELVCAAVHEVFAEYKERTADV